MPKSKKVASLYNLCLESIKESILKGTVAASGAKASAIEWGNDVCSNSNTCQHNLFHQLPTAILEDIIKSLIPFSDLPFSAYSQYNILCKDFHKVWCIARKSVLKHLYTPKLKTLWILPFFDDFLKLLPHYENLQVLHFSENVANDIHLRTLGVCCKQLRVLDVSRSSNVTDTGIKWFCLGFEHRGTKYEGVACKSIQSLFLKSTKITKVGILTCLRHLPVLRILFHHLTFTVLAEIAKGLLDHNFPGRPLYSLSYLFVPKLSTYESASLELAISLCPLLIQVGINLENGFTSKDIFCLTSLKMLRGLLFMKKESLCSEPCRMTFDSGVAPVLKEIGCSLEYLEISICNAYEFMGNNIIPTIIEFCPNLISLVMENSYRIPGRRRRSSFINLTDNRPARVKRGNNFGCRQILTELKYLYLGWTPYNFPIPSNDLLSLLSSPSLVDVRILSCRHLTDEVLLQAFKFHGFQNLTCLDLSLCYNFTSKGIDVFLVDGNYLSRLYLCGCFKIFKQDILDWVKVVKEKNWDLEIIDSCTSLPSNYWEDIPPIVLV